MSDIDQVLENLNHHENMYLKDLKESMYRQGRRTTPFNFSDYPRLRRHIIDRDTRLYDLPPVIEDTYSTYDNEGSVRNMASSVLAKRYKKNRRNHNIRTLKARDRFDISRMIKAGLPEEIGRKIARERNKIDVHEGGGKSESPSSKAKHMRHNRLMRLDPEYRMATHNRAATHLQSMYRGKSARNRLSKRKSSNKTKEPMYDDYNPLKSNAPKILEQTVRAPFDIQDKIGDKMLIIKLQQLEKNNELLIDEIITNEILPDEYIDSFFASLISEKSGLDIITLKYLMNIDVYSEEFKVEAPNIFKIIFEFPEDVTKLFISIITSKINREDIDPLYSSTTFASFLNYLVFDDEDDEDDEENTNLIDFINNFRLELNTSSDYTPIIIERFINDFLNMIKPYE